MKLLVLGCNGMAGHLIGLYFKEAGHDVVGFARQSSKLLDTTVIGDVTDFQLLADTITKGNYDAVINCVGLLNQFAERDVSASILINSYLPHYLATITNDIETRVIHMSTDCVFAGNDGPYFEDTIPNGPTVYDRTKALGELNNAKDLTFRNSIIGPDIKPEGIGLFNWFMLQSGTIKGYINAIWSGVTTLTLAQAMEKALEVNLSGLFNLGNNTSINKFDLLMLFNKFFRDNNIQILPDGNMVLDKSLRSHRKDFAFHVPSYEEQIAELKDWMDDHKAIYSHYRL